MHSSYRRGRAFAASRRRFAATVGFAFALAVALACGCVADRSRRPVEASSPVQPRVQRPNVPLSGPRAPLPSAGSPAPATGGTDGSSSPLDAGVGQAAGSSGGSAGGGAPTCGEPSANRCVNDGEPNPDCSLQGEVPPTSGVCAMSGPCCHRSSNRLKERGLCDDEALELEYRVAFARASNHPLTLGDPLLIAADSARRDREQQSLLWRIRAPRGDGREIGGVGELTVGAGRYNCDGTYSFYSDAAAPVKPGVSQDPARWAAHRSRTFIDVSASASERMSVTFADDRVRRDPIFTPFLQDDAEGLDWELVEVGFTFIDLDLAADHRDCIGGRVGGAWEPGGRFETFVPMQENDREIITLIAQTYCQLIAFGILPSASKDATTCSSEPRCLPGSSGCKWRKLPDSLCPRDDSERARFRCHLGDRDNVNREPEYPTQLDCMQSVSTAPQDPAAETPGPCCDPFGASTELPACNAYRVVHDFTAVAAEITDQSSAQLQQSCLSE